MHEQTHRGQTEKKKKLKNLKAYPQAVLIGSITTTEEHETPGSVYLLCKPRIVALAV